MKIRNISNFTEGYNGDVTVNIGGKEISYSVVDDLIIKTIDFQPSALSLVCESGLSPTGTVELAFEGVTAASLQTLDTYDLYNVHQEGTDLRIIDQIVYDPSKKSEDAQVVVVGFGWVLKLDADIVVANYSD